MDCVQTYNHKGSLTTEIFWKSGVMSAVIDAAIVFFITYYAIKAGDRNAINDAYSMGKVRQGCSSCSRAQIKY